MYLGSGAGSGVLGQHPGVTVEAAVHTGLPVTLVSEDIVLEPTPAGLSVCDPVSTLIVDIALLGVREVSLRTGALIVGDFTASIDQVFLDADTEIPVRSSDVHQPGESISSAHVLQLRGVTQLSPGLSVHCLLVY